MEKVVLRVSTCDEACPAKVFCENAPSLLVIVHAIAPVAFQKILVRAPDTIVCGDAHISACKGPIYGTDEVAPGAGVVFGTGVGDETVRAGGIIEYPCETQ